MHGLQSFETVWEVTLKQPHTIKMVRTAGFVRDTFEIIVDDQLLLSVKVGGFKLRGSQVIYIDEEPVEVQWKWGAMSGSPERVALLHNEEPLAIYPGGTGITLETGAGTLGQFVQEADASGVSLRLIAAHAQAEKKLRGSTSWFYWIAGLSLLNSVLMWIGGGLNFLVGLAVTQLVDGIVYGVAGELGLNGNLLVILIALVIDLVIAGIFAAFGWLAMRRHRWSLILGMVLYGLDGILFLIFGGLPSFAFHIFALASLFGGFKAMQQLDNLEMNMAQQQGHNTPEGGGDL